MNKLFFVFLLSGVLFTTSTHVVFADPTKSKMSQKLMTQIDINTATLEQLVNLPGVGKKKAAAIIEYRSKNGKFKSVDELVEVKGVGKKMLEKLKGQIKTS